MKGDIACGGCQGWGRKWEFDQPCREGTAGGELLERSRA